MLDPRGLVGFFCGAGCPALCGPVGCFESLPPGERRTHSVPTAGQACREEALPGRYRLIWKATPAGEDALFGETTLLLLPPLDRRVELTLSASEARAGELLRITARNPLDVSIWHDACCDDPVFIDPLGRDSPCGPCTRRCATGNFSEVAPGGSVSIDIPIPGPDLCGLAPGRWSVVWGRHFRMAPAETAPTVLGHAEITVLPAERGLFRRGDCDGGGRINLTDPISLLGHLFLGSGAPPCPDACDADDSGKLDLTDATWLLGYLFLGGDPPARPFPDPGPDLTPDVLPCDA